MIISKKQGLKVKEINGEQSVADVFKDILKAILKMISIKTPEEIKIMAEGGKILAKIMKELEENVKPGITTKELNRLAESLILNSGGKCSFKGYDGFPSCLCTSVNEQIVHGVPSDRILKEGDIIGLDLGIFYKGFHNDMAITVPVGKVCPETQKTNSGNKKIFGNGN